MRNKNMYEVNKGTYEYYKENQYLVQSHEAEEFEIIIYNSIDESKAYAWVRNCKD